MRASFTRIEWRESVLTFRASAGELDELVTVELPSGTPRPADDLIAVFFATLAGPALTALTMDLKVSDGVVRAIEVFSGCALDCGTSSTDSGSPLRVDARSGLALAFSGGFDSLAAKFLLPDTTHLVSMEFGGWFEREAIYFSKFNPHIVRTDFRRLGFARHSWLFMLAGIILLRDALDIGRFSTGNVLESTPWNFRTDIVGAPKAHGLMASIGMRQVFPTVGLSEVATTMVTMRHFSDEIAASLQSLAAPDSGKSLRKQLLLHALQPRYGLRSKALPAVSFPDSPPLRWGQSLADDFLTPFIIKRSGKASARRLTSGIPDSVIQQAESMSLDFYEHFHTGLYLGSDPDARDLRVALGSAGIQPFTESDWREYRAVLGPISELHGLNL